MDSSSHISRYILDTLPLFVHRDSLAVLSRVKYIDVSRWSQILLFGF